MIEAQRTGDVIVNVLKCISLFSIKVAQSVEVFLSMLLVYFFKKNKGILTLQNIFGVYIKTYKVASGLG